MTLRPSNGWPFIVLEAAAVTGTGLHLHLYDRHEPNQHIAYLHDTWDRSFTSALVGPGAGSFAIHADHPAAGLIDQGDLVRFRLDGTDRFTLKVDRIEAEEVAQGDDVARVLRVSGRGALSVLAEAQAYPQINGDPTRGFPGIAPGYLSRVLIDEAIARGALTGVTRTFTDTVDSNNQPWATTLDQTERAGTDLLRVHERIAEVAADVWMTPLLELNMANTRGIDRTIQTDSSPAVVFRPGHNAVEVSSRTTTQVVNALLIETADGMVTRTDTLSIAEHGRRENFLSLGNVSDTGAVDRVAERYFETYGQPQRHVTLSLAYVDPLPWVRWAEGDWIRLYSLDGSWEKIRVVAITISERADGTLEVIPELSTITEQLEERMRRWLDAMSRGTAAGTATRVAEPVAVPADVASTITVVAGDSVATHTATVVHADILDDLTDVSVPSPTQGDMVAHNGSVWAKVGGTKADGRVPTVQADGSIQWEAPPAGGGGGGPVEWTQLLNDSAMANLTGWTVRSGTWTPGGAYGVNETGTGGDNWLEYATATVIRAIRATVRVTSAGTALGFGFNGSHGWTSPSGGFSVGLAVGSNSVWWDRYGSGGSSFGLGGLGITLALNTDIDFYVVQDWAANKYLVYVNGVFALAIYPNGGINGGRVGLYTRNSTGWWRDLSVWTADPTSIPEAP